MSEPTESTVDTATVTEEPASQTAISTEDEVKPKENGAGGGRDDHEKEPKPTVAAAPPPAKPKYRHDWYQTPTDVYINVMIKGLKNEDVSVHFEEKKVDISINLSGGETFQLELSLAHPVVPGRCAKKVLRTKLELKLRKLEGLQWSSLETPGDETLKQPSDVNKKPDEDDVHKYPSSAHYTRNWDKLVADVKKEEKDEKLEGDAALNQLFQQIYKDGNDEVRKAMNKSFVESGGTVLSTNWGEVGKGKVDRKPPDGMEWKEYEK